MLPARESSRRHLIFYRDGSSILRDPGQPCLLTNPCHPEAPSFGAEGSGRATRTVALFATHKSRAWLASLLLETRQLKLETSLLNHNLLLLRIHSARRSLRRYRNY